MAEKKDGKGLDLDCDFLKDDFEDIEKAKCLATFVDGELVYHG